MSACTGGSDGPSSAAQERAGQTIAYAEQLAERAPQLPGQVPLRGAPPKDLEKPNEIIGVGDLVVRARYWTVPGSADHAYRALKRMPVKGLRLSGYGLPSRSADDSPGRGFLNYQILDLPDFLQGGELYLEMEPDPKGGSVIAAFAEVFAHPVRSATEHIEPAGATGSSRWPKVDGEFPNAKVSHPTHVLEPAEVRAFVSGFNRSPVADSTGTCSSPVGIETVTVTVQSGEHIWRTIYPGNCSTLTVNRDGADLPALLPDRRFVQVLDVLAHRPGTVVGRLLLVGGPVGRAPTPLAGRLTLRANGRVVASIETRNRQGRFGLTAQPGRYTVAGTSPHYRVNGRPSTCAATHPVVVKTNQKTHADVYCNAR
jgi:hypothetical protein